MTTFWQLFDKPFGKFWQLWRLWGNFYNCKTSRKKRERKKKEKETAELIQPWIRMIKLSEKKFKINEALTLWQNDTELNKDDLWAKLAETKWNNLILEDTMKQTKARTGMKWTKQWKMCGYQMPKEEIGHKMSQNGWN